MLHHLGCKSDLYRPCLLLQVSHVIFSDFDPLIPRGSKKEFLTQLYVFIGNRHEMQILTVKLRL